MKYLPIILLLFGCKFELNGTNKYMYEVAINDKTFKVDYCRTHDNWGDPHFYYKLNGKTTVVNVGTFATCSTEKL